MAGPDGSERAERHHLRERCRRQTGPSPPQAFADWNLNSSPATYDTSQDLTAKWHDDAAGSTAATSSTAGTASGTITYSFGTSVTAAQQTAFTDTLTLWSDEAGLAFTQAAAGTKADVVFKVTGSGATDNESTSASYDSVGSTAVSSFLTPDQQGGGQDTITFNNDGSYGKIGDFSTVGGYGVSALTHEVGHMIGLGHSGPYNDGGGVSPDTAQYNAFDSRQYSVMSYIDPGDKSAKYYKSIRRHRNKMDIDSGQHDLPGRARDSDDGRHPSPRSASTARRARPPSRAARSSASTATSPTARRRSSTSRRTSIR